MLGCKGAKALLFTGLFFEQFVFNVGSAQSLSRYTSAH